MCLYRYFSEVAAKSKGKQAEDYDSDADSVSDTEFDEFLGMSLLLLMTVCSTEQYY